MAGIWGSGTGSTTLTENMHTIDITKVANRKVVEIGAALLILFSFFGNLLFLYLKFILVKGHFNPKAQIIG